MNISKFNTLKNLISEQVVSPAIKFISFTGKELKQWKDCDEINLLRPLSQVKNILINDLIKTDWEQIYQVQDIQILNDLADYQYLNLLDTGDIQQLCEVNEAFYYLKLVKYIKKDVVRFFYDCEFEETLYEGIKLISIGMVDEFGNELYLINKDYVWAECRNQWLIDNVKPFIDNAPEYLKVHKAEMIDKILSFIKPALNKDIKLYGYYSAYDHVCFCQIFGLMADLLAGLPMFTHDLKQVLDYLGIPSPVGLLDPPTDEHDALCDAKWNLNLYKALKEKYGIYM